ncbi:hypothetical protein BF269_004234 [Escherichia coli]|nr:hypothetical protein [Escherichia coli]
MIPDDVLARVFPAPAGINRRPSKRKPKPCSVPRASGDKPATTQSGDNLTLCSPRQRG